MSNTGSQIVLLLLLRRANDNKVALDPQISIALTCVCRFLYYSVDSEKTWTRLIDQFILPFLNHFRRTNLFEGTLTQTKHDNLSSEWYLGKLKKRVISLFQYKCHFCSNLTRFWFRPLDQRVCSECYMHEDERATVCSRRYAKNAYLVTDKQLKTISYVKEINITLFLVRDVKSLCIARWGSIEEMNKEKAKRDEKKKRNCSNLINVMKNRYGPGRVIVDPLFVGTSSYDFLNINNISITNNSKCFIVHNYYELMQAGSHLNEMNDVVIIKIDTKIIQFLETLYVRNGCLHLVGVTQENGEKPILQISHAKPLIRCQRFCQVNFESLTLQMNAQVRAHPFNPLQYMCGIHLSGGAKGVFRDCAISCVGVSILCRENAFAFVENCYFGRCQDPYLNEIVSSICEKYDGKVEYVSDLSCAISLIDVEFQSIIKTEATEKEHSQIIDRIVKGYRK
eukprot:Pgem_evm1s3129